MKKMLLVTAALLVASPSFAQNTMTPSSGASKYAPGQAAKTSTKSASELAPGHQYNNKAVPGHSESAPGQRMNNPTTTGSNMRK